MGGWMGQCADLLDPLYERLKSFVLESKVVGTDDTPGESSGPKPAASAQGPRVAVCRRSRSSDGGLRLHGDARAGGAGEVFGRLSWAIYRPTPTWLTTVCSTNRNAVWSRWAAGRMRAVIFTTHWRAIARTWAQCCYLSASSRRWRSLPVKRDCAAKICGWRGNTAPSPAGAIARVLGGDSIGAAAQERGGQAVAYILHNWTALTRYARMAIYPSTTTPPSGRSVLGGRPQQLDVFRQRQRWEDRGGAPQLCHFLRAGEGRPIRLVSRRALTYR